MDRKDLHAAGGRPAERRLVTLEPPNLESSAEGLVSPLTPNEEHFVRTHFGVPRLDPEHHAIRVRGARTVELSVHALRSRPWRRVAVTLECAGNGRLRMSPLPPGEPWGERAVGTAIWEGVPLADLLHEVGIPMGAVEVLAIGADRGSPARTADEVPFAHAVPLRVALAPDTLVALEMNGRPLPPEHGAPARLVVPSWYGMASVKWLSAVEIVDTPFTGYFQHERYVYVAGGRVRPVAAMRVRSIFVSPEADSVRSIGPCTAWGWAWSGLGAVTSVQLSLDGGDWIEASLDAPISPHAWRRFHQTIELGRRGRSTLRCRARDAAGRIQPLTPPHDRWGYGNNAVGVTTFFVE